jgi:hypothetical protein
MHYFKRFNTLRFLILLFVIGGLTVFSFLTAFGKDEGTLGDNLLLNFMADAFYVFRFPMHVLVWKYMTGNIFFLGLFINIFFYAVLIEAIISKLINRTKVEASAH